MANRKNHKGYFVVWWYPGGPLNKEITEDKEYAELFAKSIRRCGGSATVYDKF